MSTVDFTSSKLRLTKTPLVGQLVRGYLEKVEWSEKLTEFQPDLNGLKGVLEKRRFFLQDRKLIHSVISEQYDELARFGETLLPEEKQNISALAEVHSFTITTGHQLQLAGGPLFLAFKILSAVATARHIRTLEPESKVVPVFWLASEDHDMAEIDHFNYKEQELKWKTDWQGASGEATCSDITDLIDELQEISKNDAYSEEFIDILRSAYKPEYSLSIATRILIHRLFGRFGVISIDANDARLKSKFADILRDELTAAPVKINVEKSVKLFPAPVEPQVNPRDINLFYLIRGSRNRIVKEGTVWKVLDTDIRFDQHQLLEELKNHPERFSPNVLLRPVYQSSMLPDLAYIGGPGELAYWLELADLFGHFKVPMPLVLPRNFFLQLDIATSAKMEKAGIDEMDLFKSIDELMKRHIEKKLDTYDPFPGVESLLSKEYSSIEKVLSDSDKSLEASVKGELQKSLKGLQQLREKWIRAEKRKAETIKSQLEKIHHAVFPGGIFQERKASLAEYYMKYGSRILDVWLENCSPINDSLTVLKEKTQA